VVLLRRLPDFGEEVELPWPRAGDELFAPADDVWLNAHIGAFRGDSYTIGYKAAGDVLVDHVAQHEIEADTLVFPIVFCYRQYLELLLKGVLSDARKYYEIENVALVSHSLMVPWEDLRTLLTRRWPESQGI